VRPAWPPARKVVGALAVALAAASVLPAIDTNLWWIRIFSYPRVQFFWMLPGVVVASLLLPDRFRWSGIASSAIAAAALAYQASVLTPGRRSTRLRSWQSRRAPAKAGCAS
jgi:hypothetical protein